MLIIKKVYNFSITSWSLKALNSNIQNCWSKVYICIEKFAELQLQSFIRSSNYIFKRKIIKINKTIEQFKNHEQKRLDERFKKRKSSQNCLPATRAIIWTCV